MTPIGLFFVPLSEEVKIFLADDPSVLGALDQRLEPTEVSDLGVLKISIDKNRKKCTRKSAKFSVERQLNWPVQPLISTVSCFCDLKVNKKAVKSAKFYPPTIKVRLNSVLNPHWCFQPLRSKNEQYLTKNTIKNAIQICKMCSLEREIIVSSFAKRLEPTEHN